MLDSFTSFTRIHSLHSHEYGPLTLEGKGALHCAKVQRHELAGQEVKHYLLVYGLWGPRCKSEFATALAQKPSADSFNQESLLILLFPYVPRHFLEKSDHNPGTTTQRGTRVGARLGFLVCNTGFGHGL